MELKGTKTEQNLREAFAGETQARSKYDYFASVAKKAGYEQIAAIFQETADQEKEHAELWFKEFHGIGDTAQNLAWAAEGENDEWTNMYARMADEADAEGFCARFADEGRRLAAQLAHAKELYPCVAFPDDIASFSSGLCSEMSIDGYRADIALMRAARAMAALDGRDCATRDDVLSASRFVLPHRLRRSPFEEVSFDDKVLERAMNALEERGLDTHEAKAESSASSMGQKIADLSIEKADEGKK